MTTNNSNNSNKFFEVRLAIYAGSNERKAFDTDAMRSLGFTGVDFDSVKAMLQTAVLPKEAFYPFLAVRKSVQEFLAQKGMNHDLLGRLFNPQEREEIILFLNEKKSEYEEAKKVFLADYARAKSEQLEKVRNSAALKGLEPEPLVRAVAENQPSVEYYARKFEFRFIDSSIELDAEEWRYELKKINEDLVERTCYELSRDAEKIRNDLTSTTTRVSKILEQVARLRSLSFYIPALSSLASDIEELVNNHCGGVKRPKEYSQAETLLASSLVKVVWENARNLVKSKATLKPIFLEEAERVAMLLQEDEDQLNIGFSESQQDLEVKPEPEPELIEEIEAPSVIEEIVDVIPEFKKPPAPAVSSVGAFAF
ncbi:DUF3150 domain-containing protein [Thiomicrorhabdus aquaedulcis]|uniref:DUF3150 domain-containing protein n=1 Tax=Thiomicrorhabdus aquaedulcis TaxID=2211106 RepID=UPI001562D2AE|nr:DUF3150 domain-containing protein [Thiomicrorhabdus aquaedulcis]